ncbi:sugar ABC transporter substrate-binding protein [Glaciihabitans sp. UYNi722]|uniref:sugar ABC transporter substrate-binding protein n=1 Tax=Glaciihabitans sp. UYNi722 TaxID=3156344 RepID=UPI0033927860
MQFHKWSRPLIKGGISAVAVVLALSGCASVSGTGTGSSAKPNHQIVIGYAGPTLTNAFFVGLNQGISEGTKKLGYKLISTNANGDASQQFNDATNLLSRGIDVLILSPIDAKAITPAVKQANAAKIPVFTLDRGSDGGTITSFVASDNVAAGKTAADWIAKTLTAKNGSAKGNVVNLVGLVGTTAATDRDKGFKEGLKAYPGIKIVAEQEGGFDQEKSLNAMTNILQANSQIDAVFGANDDNTVGAERAIDGANRFKPIGDPGHIAIIGIDGTAQALSAIRAGKQDATISQNPIKMAEKSLTFVSEYVAGKTVPATYAWPTFLLDSKNIDGPEAKAYGLWSAEIK